MVLRKRKRDHVTPLLAQLHWLPVQQRIQHKMGTLAFRHFDGSLPPYLAEKLAHHKTSRTLRSSEQLLLSTPQTKLRTAGDRSFTFQTPHIWNSIPLEIRNSPSLETFKKNMKTHLFQSVFKAWNKTSNCRIASVSSLILAVFECQNVMMWSLISVNIC